MSTGGPRRLAQKGAPGNCTYCGAHTEHAEDEHVFPASWYPDDTPANVERPQVPSCSNCNRNLGKVESRLLRAWGLSINHASGTAAGVVDRVLRSYQPDSAKNATDAQHRSNSRDSLFRRMIVTSADDPDAFPGLARGPDRPLRHRETGLVVRGKHAIEFDYADVQAFTKKLVRGMYRYQRRRCLPASTQIETYVVAERAWPKVMESVKDPGFLPFGVPPGFVGWYGVATEDPNATVWYFLIWGQIFLQGASGSAISRPGDER